MLYSNKEKEKLEDVILACLRCGHGEVMEHILGNILERRKLVDWKVNEMPFRYFLVITAVTVRSFQLLNATLKILVSQILSIKDFWCLDCCRRL